MKLVQNHVGLLHETVVTLRGGKGGWGGGTTLIALLGYLIMTCLLEECLNRLDAYIGKELYQQR